MAALAAAVRPVPGLFSQQSPAPASAEEIRTPAVNLPEEVAEPGLRFFSAQEMAALRRLADVLVPPTATPGALEAGAPEFLDFYLSQSPSPRQDVYREGLERLGAEARRQFGKGFAELGITQIEPLLAPLRVPWSARPAGDRLSSFLRAAKDDLLRATWNSREWALGRRGRPRRSLVGSYWYRVE